MRSWIFSRNERRERHLPHGTCDNCRQEEGVNQGEVFAVLLVQFPFVVVDREEQHSNRKNTEVFEEEAE
jgi:hypothetical protein